MRFNIISNLHNGVGLQRDYEFLKELLTSWGHVVQGVQFNANPFVIHPADVNIFDEVVNPAAFRAAPIQWVMPHPEWWFHGWEQCPWNKVLAKTHDCDRIFKAKVQHRCYYIGWVAKDLYRPEIPRERKFLHVTGKSKFKNTPAVIEGCQKAGVPLTVIGQNAGRRVNEHELVHAMNSHFCHVMPSAYEGYGHVLHESQSTGQVLITTDAPPMNEVKPSFRLPSIGSIKHHAGTLHQVSSEDVAKAVRRVMDLPQAEVDKLASEARATYLRDVQRFHTTFHLLVG